MKGWIITPEEGQALADRLSSLTRAELAEALEQARRLDVHGVHEPEDYNVDEWFEDIRQLAGYFKRGARFGGISIN